MELRLKSLTVPLFSSDRMPKLVVDIPDEVAEFMSRHHISNVNLVQAGYDILKVIYGERKVPDREAVMKTIFGMYGHFDEIDKIKNDAELHGYKLVKDPSVKEAITVE